ncbi:MAG: OmpA family protein [Alphaproteobacteria bacterium]|nr:OmpA family protein [Alphaproteobacteria bacterium]
MNTILRLFFGALMALPMLYLLPASAQQAGSSAQSAPIVLAQKALTPEQEAKRKARKQARQKARQNENPNAKGNNPKARQNAKGNNPNARKNAKGNNPKARKNAKGNNPNARKNAKGNNPNARKNAKGNNPQARSAEQLRQQRRALQKKSKVPARKQAPVAKQQQPGAPIDGRSPAAIRKQQLDAKSRQLQRRDNNLDDRARQLRNRDQNLDARQRTLNTTVRKRRKIQTRQIQKNSAALQRAQQRQQTLRQKINTTRNRADRLQRRNNRLSRQRNWLQSQRRTDRRRAAWNNFGFRERAKVLDRRGNRTIFAAIAGAAVGAAIVGAYYVHHNDSERIYSWRARDVYVDDLSNDWSRHVVVRPDGTRVVTIRDANGFIVRRYRVYTGNRVVMLYDNQPRWWDDGDLVVDVAPVRYSGPGYIVEPSDASVDEVYDVVVADPVQEIDRTYTLNQILMNRNLRDYMPRIDLDTINFATGSAEIDESQLDRLDEVGAAMEAAIKENPDEVYLIEGYTDAVGDAESNAVLSDERAAAVANALTQYYDIPPENLVTQGYGEDFLKVDTGGPERRNRRVAIRRITPLLANDSEDIALDGDGNEIFEQQ